MAIVLSPSSLWSFQQCPYRRVNSTYDVDPRATAHWALWNIAAASAISWTWIKLWPRIRYYNNNINIWLDKKKQLSTEVLKEWMWKIYKFFKQYVTSDYQLIQEQKFEYQIDPEEDVWISWQPDVVILYNNPNKEDKIVAEIIDIKVWKVSWYEKKEIWFENFQWVIYPRFIFNHFGQEFLLTWIDKPLIKFSFAVMDKSTWDFQLFSKTLDEYTVNFQIKQQVKQYRELQKQNLDKKDYPATKCRWCAFCEFADTCPLKAAEVSVTNEELNDLF